MKDNGDLFVGIQYEVEAVTISEHIVKTTNCAKCGKFKKQNTKSVYCRKCLGL